MARILLALLLILAPASVRAGVVSAADPRAAEAGREILRAGGSAADAAIATMLALTVVEPQSSGIGGGGFLVHHSAASGQVSTIDGRETAPASARPDRFLGPDGRPLPFSRAFPGGLSVGVPGNMRLAELAHRKHGKLKWSRLFQPAIRLAIRKLVKTCLPDTPVLSFFEVPEEKAVEVVAVIGAPQPTHVGHHQTALAA